MKKEDQNSRRPDAAKNRAGVSRRTFLAGTGRVSAVAAAAATGLMSAGAAGQTTAEPKDACPAARLTKELPIPAGLETPQTTEYKCDVLIIGGGFGRT